MKYSKVSASRLSTCHHDLQVIFNAVILKFDNSILCGVRGENDQDDLYNAGKTKVKYPNSKHNKTPSMAVDSAPYPIVWGDRERFSYYAGYVIGVAEMLRHQGLITHRIRWGGDWDSDTEVKDNEFDDLPHFELVEV